MSLENDPNGIPFTVYGYIWDALMNDIEGVDWEAGKSPPHEDTIRHHDWPQLKPPPFDADDEGDMWMDDETAAEMNTPPEDSDWPGYDLTSMTPDQWKEAKKELDVPEST